MRKKCTHLKWLDLQTNGQANPTERNVNPPSSYPDWQKRRSWTVKDDGFFEAFRAKIWVRTSKSHWPEALPDHQEKTNPDVPDGPISRYLDGGENDEDDSDDEVEAGGTIKNYQCPLSRTTLVDAQTRYILSGYRLASAGY
jgi:hypothetical protein